MTLSFAKPAHMTVLCLSLIAILFIAAPAQADWPDNDRNCQKPTEDYERDCLETYKYAVRDMATRQISIVHRHKSTKLTKSGLRKALKLQGFLKSELKTVFKWKTRVDFGSYTADIDNIELEGLRSESGELLLKTAFDEVFPLSPTHSVVKLSNRRYKIAEHRTHKLSDLPGEAMLLNIEGATPSPTVYFKHLFLLSTTGKRNYENASVVPLLPDLTLGTAVKNVHYVRRDVNSHFGSDHGAGYSIKVNSKENYYGEWSNLVFDEWNQPLDLSVEEFAVNYGKLAKSRNYKSSVSAMAEVGEMPKKDISYELDKLYWPYDKNNNLMPRPDNILGMTAISRDGRGAPGIYLGGKRVDDIWLVVFRDGADYDYALATFGNTSSASTVAKQIDKFQILDDVYFRNGLFDNIRAYALKPKSTSGIAQPWYAYRADESPREDFFAVAKGNDINTPFKGATAHSALAALDAAEAAKARGNAIYEAEKAAKAAAAYKRDSTRGRWRRPETENRPPNTVGIGIYFDASICQGVLKDLERKPALTANEQAWGNWYTYHGYDELCGRLPPTYQGWLPQTETVDGRTFIKPQQRTPAPYTLQKGLEDIGRAAACTRQERKCVSDGQYERCRMVTVNIC